MKPSSSRVKKWEKWFKEINNEITSIWTSLQIIEQFNVIVDHNDTLKNHESIFWAHFPKSIALNTVMQICRICDKQARKSGRTTSYKSVISLRALLEEFKEYNEHFSRRRFVGRIHPPKPESIDSTDYLNYIHSNEIFDKYAGQNKKHLSKKDIEKDIKILDATVEKSKKFRNKFLGHKSIRQKIHKPLKYAELDKCRKIISKIANKYLHLLSNRHQIYNLDPNISDLFTFKWIESTEVKKLINTEIGKINKNFENLS